MESAAKKQQEDLKKRRMQKSARSCKEMKDLKRKGKHNKRQKGMGRICCEKLKDTNPTFYTVHPCGVERDTCIV